VSLSVPKGLKRAVWGTVLLAGMVGYGAASDLYLLIDPPTVNVSQFPAFPGFEGHPEVWREAMRAWFDTQMSAYASMEWSRGLILFALCVLTSVVFAEGMRLARIDGGREGSRRRLARAVLGAAVLRTLEGAQNAAVARRAGAAMDKVLSSTSDLPGGWPDAFATNLFSGGAMVLSLVVVGGLLLLSMYFRSENVKQAVAALDAQTPSE
jgi:hypothetical protein